MSKTLTVLNKRDIQCPHCGGWFGPGYFHHERACAKRPTNELLREHRENGATYRYLSQTYGVSRETISRWLQEAGISGNFKHIYKNGEKPLQFYPEMAHLFGKMHFIGCRRCPSLVWCRLAVNMLGCALCEAPDDRQLVVWKHRGWIKDT